MYWLTTRALTVTYSPKRPVSEAEPLVLKPLLLRPFDRSHEDVDAAALERGNVPYERYLCECE